jgi:DNA-binding beta-propeller fold protein YncE
VERFSCYLTPNSFPNSVLTRAVASRQAEFLRRRAAGSTQFTMKTAITFFSSTTSRIRVVSLAVTLWFGWSGIFPLAGATEQSGPLDTIGKFSVGVVLEGVLFDGTYVWVTDGYNNTVSKLQPADGTVLATYPTMGTSPLHLAFDGENIWVTHFGQTGTVNKLRASDGAFLGSFYAGQYPFDLVYAAGKIWVTNGYSGYVLRASDGKILDGFAGTGGVTFDGDSVWVADSAVNKVGKYRARDGAILGTFDVGAKPIGVAYSHGYIWVANFDDSTVSKLRASDGSLLGTFPAGEPNAEWVAVDGAGNVWVTHLYGGVSVLRGGQRLVTKHYFDITYPSKITSEGSNIWITSEYGSVYKISPGLDTSYREEKFRVGAFGEINR